MVMVVVFLNMNFHDYMNHHRRLRDDRNLVLGLSYPDGMNRNEVEVVEESQILLPPPPVIAENTEEFVMISNIEKKLIPLETTFEYVEINKALSQLHLERKNRMKNN